MAGFRVRKGQKVYAVREFASVVQLAQRGLLEAEDAVYVPALDRWVYAGAIKELRPLVGAPPEGDVRGASARDEDALELPMAYVEALDEVRPADTRRITPPHLRPDARTPRSDAMTPVTPPPSEMPSLPGLDAFTAAAAAATPSSPGLALGAERAPGSRRPPIRPLTEAPTRTGINLARVLLLLLIPGVLLGIYYLAVKSTAAQRFPASRGAAVQAAPTPPPRPPTPSAPNPLKVREAALREKIPLDLRNPVKGIDQVQDDIFAELLNAGALPTQVQVLPIIGELPPHSSLRKLDVRLQVWVRETDGVETDDQLALVGLLAGKYVRLGALKVVELTVGIEDAEGATVGSHTLTGAQVRDFYSRQSDLKAFLAWLAPEAPPG